MFGDFPDIACAFNGLFDNSVRCHITDQFSMYTEYPVALQPDGTLLLELQPDSFVFIEF